MNGDQKTGIFSFEYNKDVWRAAQVQNMGKVSGNSTFSDNDWEEVKCKKTADIEDWIDSQMKMCSCIAVLVGKTTFSLPYCRPLSYDMNRVSHKSPSSLYPITGRLIKRFTKIPVKYHQFSCRTRSYATPEFGSH